MTILGSIRRMLDNSGLRTALQSILLVAAGICVYANSLNGPFIFDDIAAIEENPHLRQLWPLGYAISAPRECSAANRPFVSLTLAINYAIGGLHTKGYHIFNVVTHILCALALFGIIRQTIRILRLQSNWLALAIALIWIVHPLNSDAINQVIYRTEQLGSLFYLLTLYCSIRSFGSSLGKLWTVAAILSCLLGMTSKENMVSAPVSVFLFDWMFVSRYFGRALKERWFLYASLMASWAVLAVCIITGARDDKVGVYVEGLPFIPYVLTQTEVIVYYLRLAFWPHPLVLEYSDWPLAESIGNVWPFAVITFLLACGTLWACCKRSWLGFSGLLFFFVLAPTSLLPNPGEMIGEHRMYLPLAAVIIVAITAARSALQLLSAQAPLQQAIAAVLNFALVVIITLALAITTWNRNSDYATKLSIWQDVVNKRPESPRGYHGLADALARSGRNQQAITQYQNALRLGSHSADVNYSLGTILAQAGKTDLAVRYFLKAIEIKPHHSKAHNNLGNALLQQGKNEEAIKHYHHALHKNPGWSLAHLNLGVALAEQKKLNQAAEQFREVIRLQPEYAKAHELLGITLLKLRNFNEAERNLQKAVELNPGNLETRKFLEEARAALQSDQ